ncbi:MAG: hypothetical protein FVQ82_01475 [Planctomycetes bacterium]|nr:hypothetical protein [Planctomycetota bacterium]
MKFFKLKSVFAGFVVCLLISSAGAARNSDTRDPVLVTVNGIKITQLQVNAKIEKDIKMAMDSLGRPLSYAMRHNMMLRAIDEMIKKIVIDKRIKSKKIKVTVKEVDEEIARVAKNMNISVQNFYSRANSTQNTTPTELRDRFAMGLRFDKLIEKEAGSKAFLVSDLNAKIYYNGNKGEFTKPARVRASHIMIKYPGNDDSSKSNVKYAMNKIVAMAKRGIDFGKMAKKYSQDNVSRKKGGDLGFIYKNTNNPLSKIEEAAFSLKAGEVSDVIEMPYGCHVIKVFKVEEAELSSFDKVKDGIKVWIKDDLKADYSAKYIDQQIAKAKIKWARGRRPEPMKIKESDLLNNR